jgi:hypothetical protein
MEMITEKGIEMSYSIQHYSFLLNERRLCVWGVRMEDDVQQFLMSIDPTYFDHIAQMHGPQLSGEHQHYAATALRVAYSHGLETLFALIGATIQAPLHPLAWIAKYTNEDLRGMLRRIGTREPLHTRLAPAPAIVSWYQIAEHIFELDTDDETEKWIVQAYATLWKRFAGKFLKELFEPEYNAIKHGLRVTMHGSHLWMGLEPQPGVSPPPDRMMYMGGSEFGTFFYDTERLHDRYNFRMMQRSQNWNPQKFVHALPLISNPINNIVLYLKGINGMDISDMTLSVPGEIPGDNSQFNAPWAVPIPGMPLNEMNTLINPALIKPLSPEQIDTEYFGVEPDE